MSETPILLITGASGRIGSFYRRHLREWAHGYQLRLSDVKPPVVEEDGEWRIGNLTEPAFAQQLMRGVDTVLHLGADPRPDADFYDSLLDNNFKSTYNIYRAAADANVSKVIYASSGQAVLGYPDDVQIHTDQAVRPMNMYGVSKCFGEATAACFAVSYGLPSICVRIGWVVSREEISGKSDYNPYDLNRAVTEEDLCRLLDCCLTATGISYAIVHGESNNRFPRLDLSETRALLGYEPQDDAFTLAGVLPPAKGSSDAAFSKMKL